MMARHRKGIFVILIGVVLLGGLQTSNVSAQTRAISLAVPEIMLTTFRDIVLSGFQEAHPDIFVELRTVNVELYQALQPSTTSRISEDYLDAMNQFVSKADVHFIHSNYIIPENTRAGYFLNISPMTDSEPSSLFEDTMPSMREAFTWDGGQWALPLLAMPLVAVYNPAAFDAVGLDYPNESWEFDEFANAARQLKGDDLPGMRVSSYDLPLFFRILTGHGMVDSSLLAEPDFEVPELATFIEQWTALEAEGAVTSQFNDDVPLRFARINELINRGLQGALLSGQAGADVYAAAISSGTSDRDAAYQLAVYLTTVPDLEIAYPASLPVRYSTQDQIYESQWPLPDEARSLRLQALESAISPAEMVFSPYLNHALSQVANGEPVDAALQQVQIAASDNLSYMESLRETLQIEVAATELPIITEARTIQFGIPLEGLVLANSARWQRLIDEFVANDPSIDAIELNFSSSGFGWWDEVAKNDCVIGYAYDSYIDDGLLPLDPLFDADPTFDPADTVGDVMLDVQLNGTTYAVPIFVSPYVLRYNREAFRLANIPEPDGTWTVDEFLDALQQLEGVSEETTPLFLTVNSITPFELLMAGYGAAPIDYTTTPATLNFTDEQVTEAIRQVLDLAKAGLINYEPMATLPGYGILPLDAAPLMNQSLNNIDFDSDRWLDMFGLVTFPIGTDTTPVSFYTTSGFVFPHTPYPEACYRWLREITRHPDLFQGMPAYHSIIDDPLMETLYGATGVSTFQRFADLMEAPDRIFVRSYGLGQFEGIFLTHAFDRYVLNNADLDAELALAKSLTEEYRTCTAQNGDWISCIVEVDPTLRENIAPYLLGAR